jgi:preprotein translocase subunit SecE
MAKKDIKNSKDKTSFLKGFKAELKKVIWPTPKQLFNNTVAVLAIVLITALIVFILDVSFESLNKYGIDKIKEVVSNSTETNEISEDETSTEEESSEEDIEEDKNEEEEADIQSEENADTEDTVTAE